jgi:HSP20 family protein
MTTETTRWEPMRELAALRDEIESTFRQWAGPARTGEWVTTAGGWSPAVDVEENDDAYVVYAELPGVTAEDLQVSFDDGVLTVHGERKFYEEKKTETFRRVERRYGTFHRSLRLPGPVNSEKVEAAFKDGLLTVTVPKAEAAKPHRIEITQG